MALAQGRVPYSSRRPSATKARPSSCIIASLGFSNKTIPSFDSVHFRAHHDSRSGDPPLEIPSLHPNRKKSFKNPDCWSLLLPDCPCSDLLIQL